MSKTEQLTAGPVWSGDGFPSARPDSHDAGHRTAVIDTVAIDLEAARDERASGACRTIELFPRNISKAGVAPRPKKRARDVTFTEGLAILMLTAATCIALFAAIGYLCR